MSPTKLSPQVRQRFTDLLDRMQLLGDDFTSHPDDHQVLWDLAQAPESDPGQAVPVLPDEYAVQLDLPAGSTFQAGARKLIAILNLHPNPESD